MLWWILRLGVLAAYLLMARWTMGLAKPRDDVWLAEEWYARISRKVRRFSGLFRAAWMDLTGATQRRWQQLQRDSYRLEFQIEP